MIQAVSHTLDAMGVQQYLMAFLFLACYAMALGEFVGARWRRWALAGAASAAIAFTGLTDPWEHGVLVVAVALVALGAFAGAAWLLWALLGWPQGPQPALPHADLHTEEQHAPAPPQDWAGPLVLALLAAARRPARRLRLGQALSTGPGRR